MNTQGIVQLQDLFHSIDADQNGEITIEELKNALQSLTHKQEKDEIVEILKYVEHEETNSINYVGTTILPIKRIHGYGNREMSLSPGRGSVLDVQGARHQLHR
jgi:hypothetical protein